MKEIGFRTNKTATRSGCNVQGIDGNILLLLSRYLNFEFVMRKAEFKSDGGIWRAMIEDVHFERRDWAVGGISTSLKRLELADFTTMLHMEGYTAFFVAPESKAEDWQGILRPFHITSWIFLGFLSVFVGSILALSERVECSGIFTNRNVNTFRFVRVPFQVIVDQSTPRLYIRKFSVRLILSVWFLTSIILSTVYKSKLTATMIRPRVWEPSTVIDMYKTGYSFQVNNEDWTVLKESLTNSIDTRYNALLDRCFDNLTFCDAVKKSLTHKVAVFDEETAIPFIIFNTCQNTYEAHDMVRFRILNEQLFPSVHAWPLRLGAPYRHRFSHTFQILISTGIIEHWYKALIGRSIGRSNSDKLDSSATSALTRKSFSGARTLLIVGWLLATTVFIFENVHKKCSKKK